MSIFNMALEPLLFTVTCMYLTCMHGWMDGWIDAWMDGWIDGWMYAWTDGRLDG